MSARAATFAERDVAAQSGGLSVWRFLTARGRFSAAYRPLQLAQQLVRMYSGFFVHSPAAAQLLQLVLLSRQVVSTPPLLQLAQQLLVM